MSTSLVFRTRANHSQSPEGTVWGFAKLLKITICYPAFGLYKTIH
jgi:hypothetical protein